MEQTYIAIMIQSLEKKEQVLDKIIELDTVQKNQLEDPNLTPDDFDDVVEQKSKLIEQLDNLDSGFEKLFERVKEELEGNKEAYKEEIRIMQDQLLIKLVIYNVESFKIFVNNIKINQHQLIHFITCLCILS